MPYNTLKGHLIKFLIYKYYSHQENISTFQYLGSNNNQTSASNFFSHVAADNNKTPSQGDPSEVMFMGDQYLLEYFSFKQSCSTNIIIIT